MNTYQQQNKKGFILLFTIVVISVTVGLSVSLLLSATRQSQLGSLQSEAQAAFYAADTGIECGLAWVYPATPPTFTCAGMTPPDQNPDPKRNIHFFDYQRVGPAYNAAGWSTTVDWTSNSHGGGISSCGVVVITDDTTNPTTPQMIIESYGYSICSPNASGVLVPESSDPNLIERKILVKVPIISV